ncbi:MAG: hypothetical protein IT558_05965 [Alphaproteobacteria bacterium]|nr:hypothetical protein [Alphaproteobacteria bacterium]
MTDLWLQHLAEVTEFYSNRKDPRRKKAIAVDVYNTLVIPEVPFGSDIRILPVQEQAGIINENLVSFLLKAAHSGYEIIVFTTDLFPPDHVLDSCQQEGRRDFLDFLNRSGFRREWMPPESKFDDRFGNIRFDLLIDDMEGFAPDDLSLLNTSRPEWKEPQPAREKARAEYGCVTHWHPHDPAVQRFLERAAQPEYFLAPAHPSDAAAVGQQVAPLTFSFSEP